MTSIVDMTREELYAIIDANADEIIKLATRLDHATECYLELRQQNASLQEQLRDANGALEKAQGINYVQSLSPNDFKARNEAKRLQMEEAKRVAMESQRVTKV